MKTGDYIDHLKAMRNEALEREAVVRKALKRFLFLTQLKHEGKTTKPEEWQEAITMAQDALSYSEYP